jgi:cytochrome c oxidase cbb3-type subunit IV
MHKEVLRAISGIGMYPTISLVVFVLFFITVFFWAVSMRSSEARRMAALPLHDGTDNQDIKGDSRHG